MHACLRAGYTPGKHPPAHPEPKITTLSWPFVAAVSAYRLEWTKFVVVRGEIGMLAENGGGSICDRLTS